MTIWETYHYQCAVCGTIFTHDEILSSFSLSGGGWSDLDFRPPRIPNSPWETPEYQSCPTCGYVAKNIEDEISDEIKEFVLSDEYKKIQPKTTAGHYKALLAISLKKADYTAALSAAHHLAWIYEDDILDLDLSIARGMENEISAKELEALIEKQRQAIMDVSHYRRKALGILETHEDELTLNFDIITCLKADLHRRCGDFDEVIEFCRKNGSSDRNIREVLRFEVYLSSQNDSSRHNVGEAKKYCADHRWEEGITLQNGNSVTVPKIGRTWTCSVCGTEGLTGNYCPKCRSDAWICPKCHHKWNSGNVCDNCKAPKPVEKVKERWTCPECHYSGNDGKICRHCKTPKP